MEWKPITNNYSYFKIIIFMIVIYESFNYLIKTNVGIDLVAISIFIKIGVTLILIPVHEFIHFIVGNIFACNKGKVHTGFTIKSLVFYMNVDGIYKRNGYVCYTIAPCLLSVVLSIFCIYYNVMNEIIWQFIFYNIVGSTVDILDFINIMYKYRNISYYKLEKFKLFGSKQKI